MGPSKMHSYVVTEFAERSFQATVRKRSSVPWMQSQPLCVILSTQETLMMRSPLCVVFSSKIVTAIRKILQDFSEILQRFSAGRNHSVESRRLGKNVRLSSLCHFFVPVIDTSILLSNKICELVYMSI